jgi:hypothetical protein
MQRLQQLSVKMQVLQLEAPVGPPPFRPAIAYKDVDPQGTEDILVRRSKLPVQYDDRGNVKEYTEKEKKDLRGKDPKVPGFAALWADVQTGQKVKLYLKSKKAIEKAKKSLADTADKGSDDAKSKEEAKSKQSDESKAPDNDKEDDKKSKAGDSEKETRVYAYMILIEAEPGSAAAANLSQKKN